MVDLAIPQTKYAQKLRQYEGVLPSYLKEIDEAAQAAGLTVRHLDDSSACFSRVMLLYSGTRRQISHFLYGEELEGIRWPSGTRVASRAEASAFPLYKSRESARLFRIGESRFVVEMKQRLPVLSDVVADGIQRFEFASESVVDERAYFGTKSALIHATIAAPEMFPDDCTDSLADSYESGIGAWRLRETCRAPGGRWWYVEYPKNIEEVDTLRSAGRGVFESSEAFHKTALLGAAASRDIFRQCVKASDRFSLAPEALNRIAAAFSALDQAVDEARIIDSRAPAELPAGVVDLEAARRNRLWRAPGAR